ncbi:MAG TPA: IS256 family transposase [Vicinamibacterales bacterium]
MTQDTKNPYGTTAEILPTSLEMVLRSRARSWIEQIVHEELEGMLGAAPSARVETRVGYRHGTRARTLTTSLGPTTVALPRARLQQPDGTTTEWHSRAVRRYERRTELVDEAILGVYLSGTNTRRIKGALAPLLRGGPLSKDAVSRLVGRLADDFETWRTRDLAGDAIQYLILDGWFPKVRIGKRRARVPVLVTLGVRADGERIILDLRLGGDESTAAWRDVIRSLVERHIGLPQLAIIDGCPGLMAALREQWAALAIQRCTTHKLRNLEAKAPVRLREELAEDYRRMVYGESRVQVDQARARFVRKWRLRCPAVVECVEDAGDQLFTFLQFPQAQWKALRTTNALERINEEFRRRTKTQASLPSQDAVLLLLFGLLSTGLIKLRKLDGWYDMAPVKAA